MNRRHLVATAPILLGLMGTVAPGRAEAQVAFTPGVGTIPDGVSLNAVPVVSADRRYVRLTLNPNFTTVDGFQNVGIPFGVSGLGSGAGVGGAGLGGVLGVPMGMNGPAAGSGLASAAGGPIGAFPSAPVGVFDGSASSFATADDMAWSPNPRRTRVARTKAARTKKAAPAPANSPVTAPPGTKPTR